MFDFKFSMKRLIVDILFLFMYIGWFWAVFEFDAYNNTRSFVFLILSFCYGAAGILCFCSDITPEKRIRPTVKTAGLFAIMIFFLIRFVECL